MKNINTPPLPSNAPFLKRRILELVLFSSSNNAPVRGNPGYFF